MKFTIDYDRQNAELQQLEFTPEEYSDLKLAIENVGGGIISLMTMFSADMTEDGEGRQAILKAVLDYVNTNVNKIAGGQQAEYFDYPFEEMEGEFINWVYGMGYDDPYAFAEEYREKGIQLDFAVENDEAVVFFRDRDGNRCDEIGTIPAYLFEDEEELAAARCIEYTCIAALALDKVYGHENNPLRNRPVNTLEAEIRKAVLQ